MHHNAAILLAAFWVLASNALDSDNQTIVYYGSGYERSFSEPKSDGISIMWQDYELTSFANPLHGNWYVETNSNSEMTIVTLKNNNITTSTPSDFVVTIAYSTGALTIHLYNALDAVATDDFTLFTSEKAVQSFTLTCRYNASGLATVSESLTDLYWAFGGDVDATKLSSFETKQSHLIITRNGQMSSLKVLKKETEVRFNIDEPLSAFAGLYSCHVLVSRGDSTLHGTIPVNVYAKAKSVMLQNREQFMSKENADILCVVYGHPPPVVGWSFSRRQQGEPQHSDKAFDTIEAKEGKHVFTNDTEAAETKYKLMDTNTGVKSLLLVLDADNLLDRGVYRCEGSNIYGMSEAKFYMRVRYRYGWVYPLIGIVAEFVAVALSIFIFSRRSASSIVQAASKTVIQTVSPSETISLPPEYRVEGRTTSLPTTPPLSVMKDKPVDEIAPELINVELKHHPNELSKVIVEDSNTETVKQ